MNPFDIIPISNILFPIILGLVLFIKYSKKSVIYYVYIIIEIIYLQLVYTYMMEFQVNGPPPMWFFFYILLIPMIISSYISGAILYFVKIKFIEDNGKVSVFLALNALYIIIIAIFVDLANKFIALI